MPSHFPHSLQALSLIILSLSFTVSKEISVFGGGRALLALGPVAQLQDGSGSCACSPAPAAEPGAARGWLGSVALLQAPTPLLSSVLPGQCCCSMIAGNLGSTLTFSILPCHSSSQNKCTARFGPVVKNNLLFLFKMKIILLTSLAILCFYLNIFQDQVAMISACLLLSFLCYEWDVAFVC